MPAGVGDCGKGMSGEKKKVGGEDLCDPLEMGEGEGGRWFAVERRN